MINRFHGKLVWITGASSGIGEALAYAFARCGSNLILSARRKHELERVADQCIQLGATCFIQLLDLSQSDQLESTADFLLDRFGTIDVLVNNGGISQRSLVRETTLEIDRKIMEVDYFSGVILTKKLLPSMLKNGYGHIIAVSSVTGVFGFPYRSAYSAAKHAMLGFYETLWAELHENGIHVTVACPGRVHTHVSENALTGNGQVYGIMDHGQKGGITSDKCASAIIRSANRDKVIVYIGNKELWMVFFKRYIPWIFYRLVSKVQPT